MQPLRTVVVDPSRLSREGLRRIFDSATFEVVQEAAWVGDLLRPAAGEAPATGLETADLVLVDCSADPATAADELRRLRAACSNARIAVLSACDTTAFLRTCFEAPIDGLISKTVSGAVLVKSLDLMLAGQRVFPSEAMARLMGDPAYGYGPVPCAGQGDGSPLSERELEIVRCLVAGWSNKTIALYLDLTEATVKVHLKSILRKIHVRNRTQAAIWALGQGLASDSRNGRDD